MGGGEGELKSQKKENLGRGVEGTQVYYGWGGTNEVKFSNSRRLDRKKSLCLHPKP